MPKCVQFLCSQANYFYPLEFRDRKAERCHSTRAPQVLWHFHVVLGFDPWLLTWQGIFLILGGIAWPLIVTFGKAASTPQQSAMREYLDTHVSSRSSQSLERSCSSRLLKIAIKRI